MSTATGADRRALVIVAALVLSLLGCGDDGPVVGVAGPSPAPTSATTAVTMSAPTPATVVEVVEVAALDNRFEPKELTVPAGTTVRFVNHGRSDHDTLSVDGEPWGVAVADFGPGESFVHRFDQPGTYRYYCSVHGIVDFGMTGVVVVEGGPS